MKYFAFDLETTGLDIEKDEPVEIAWAIVCPDIDYRISSLLINPTVPINIEAQNVHKLSSEIVKLGISSVTLARFIRYIFNVHQIDGIIAYNGFRFDIPMLDNLLYRHGLEKFLQKLPVDDPALWWLAENIYHAKRPETLIEYQKIAALKVHYGARYNLTSVCKTLEIPLENAHAACTDLNATIKLWRKMKKG